MRKSVRCVERPPGGPPCGPLGKPCGVELHLGQLVDSIRGVQSDLMRPYLEHNRKEVCESCEFLHSEFCPCPMDYLAVLVVAAVETVDDRRAKRGRVRRFLASLPLASEAGMEEVTRAYEQGTGQWQGCDWPTRFGKTGLNLEGFTPAEAEARAVERTGAEDEEDWGAAAAWLEQVERDAREAEAEAARAVEAAGAGDWDAALRHARLARVREFATGRSLRGKPFVWQPLYAAIEAAALAHGLPVDD